nr:unnamed protein product [Callosobruchus analis]
MIHDNLSSAQVRNRAEQARLSTILHKMEKEKENDMRELNCRKKQFRARYSKLSLPSPYANKMSEVKTYDILKPRLCCKRNGEQNITCQVQNVPYVAYKQIHELVFTDGEVDIDKILCLHLISAHRSETLTPPRRKKVMCKENSPKERLIERSKRGYNSYEKVNTVLPLYTIEPLKAGAVGNYTSPPVINDGRLAARLLVNEKIRELLRSVISGLEKSNVEKLKHMTDVAHDEEYIKDVLLDKKNMEFMGILSELPLVTSCDSFVLTPPFRIKAIDLFIKTSTGVLERIINQFRHDVLQLPSRNLLVTQSMPIKIDTVVRQSPSSKSAPIERLAGRNSMDRDVGVGTSRGSVGRNEVRRESKQISQNFILKNIREASKAKKVEYDDSEENLFTRSERKSSASRTHPPPSSIRLSDIRTEESLNTTISGVDLKLSMLSSLITEEMEDKKAENGEEETNECIIEEESHSKKHRSSDNPDIPKHFVKKAMCPACMAKWRAAPPTPKTPRLRKTDVPTLTNPVFKTNSINRISLLINKEEFKLQSYDRRFSSDISNKGQIKRESIVTDNIENTDIKPMDLARIEQEIREKETEKKLQRFLNDQS